MLVEARVLDREHGGDEARRNRVELDHAPLLPHAIVETGERLRLEREVEELGVGREIAHGRDGAVGDLDPDRTSRLRMQGIRERAQEELERAIACVAPYVAADAHRPRHLAVAEASEARQEIRGGQPHARVDDERVGIHSRRHVPRTTAELIDDRALERPVPRVRRDDAGHDRDRHDGDRDRDDGSTAAQAAGFRARKIVLSPRRTSRRTFFPFSLARSALR